ncbi:MAG: hypothetical protein ACI4KA_06320 [Oscillospiraceae bacterium]
MDCAIWLNRRKVFSADEISANFDIAAIRGYFLGGSLIKWLEANGGQDYAKALSALDPADPELNDKLSSVFTKEKCTVPVHRADEHLIRAVDAMKGAGGVCSSGSYTSSGSALYGSGSYALGLYGSFGSFGGFGGFGSFGSRTWQWEWEWEYRFGSFGAGSFRYGSFSAGSFGGSYRLGSFGGSYRFMPFGAELGSYRGFPLGGSFRPMTSCEYDEIMYRCLNMCPLNRFGYGIHLI